MIARVSLLSDLQKLLQRLERDLLERSDSADVPDVGKTLRAEFDRAKSAERTAQNFEEWRSDSITQHAAAWVLACVFVRFLEDNQLIDPPRIAGPGERLQLARDEHELYFRDHPKQTDREYLLALFDLLATLPGTKDLFGKHNPIRELPNWLSGDAAGELLTFFQKIDASAQESNKLIHDFTDANWDTRFLGDLYQDLSEAARKKYALLQTPEFVEEFILERTLEPALDEFGLVITGTDSSPQAFKMIDPACGSGHFLLGSFRRILNRWQRQEPGSKMTDLVQRTLDSVHGVDVNPFAIAIARFRLLLAAMRACGLTRLDKGVPEFKLNLVCGDSLLHAPLAAGGKKYTAGQKELDFALADATALTEECEHAYRTENLPELKRILRGGQYHAVVANPPYIVPNDQILNERYRKRFISCHRQYSLAAPFMERIFGFCIPAALGRTGAGFAGQITANTFMKAEFGKKLVEDFFPRIDLTAIMDTSTAYLPGHGTPTVIVFGRNQEPVSRHVRIVSATVGEPETPREPALGLVWTALVAHIDHPGSSSKYANASDVTRSRLHKHPWTIGGNGTVELKEFLELHSTHALGDIAEDIGRTTHTGEDAAFYFPLHALRTRRLEKHAVNLVTGENIRDYQMYFAEGTLFPYDFKTGAPFSSLPALLLKTLWPNRTTLAFRRDFGQTVLERGLRWYEHSMFFPGRFRNARSIAQAFVSTHNHYVFEQRGGMVFNRTAPVIKLPDSSSDDDYLGLLSILNSSLACFWLKQVCFPKGGDQVGGQGARVRRTLWDEHYNYNSTPLKKFPLCVNHFPDLGREMHRLSLALTSLAPLNVLVNLVHGAKSVASEMQNARASADALIARMISIQEEIDWATYCSYGLMDSSANQCDEYKLLSLGQRAFEIVLARKMAAGELQTTWFERHGSTPITELPAEWPDDYRQLVERRIALIESDPNIRLIEQPEYKRRWNTESWESQLERALREWLLDRLERYFDFDGRMREGGPSESSQQSAIGNQPANQAASCLIAAGTLVSIAQLADIARQDPEFLQVGELYRDDPAFDVQKLVQELVAAESVPLLPVLRYKPSGLIKRGTWERTWELQREEDRLSDQLAAVSEQLKSTTDPGAKARLQAEHDKLTVDSQTLAASITVPTKYDSKDFLDSNLWRLRGKLDVPKERWVSFPHCEGPDGTLMIAWAGYDHLQLARAISAYYVDVQERFGGRDDPRLIPLLAGVIELLPWLKQWHNDIDPEFNQRMGDFFAGWIAEESRQLSLTSEQIKAWEPPKKVAKPRAAKPKKPKTGDDEQ